MAEHTDLSELTRLAQAIVDLDTRIHSKLSFDEIMQSTLDGYVTTLGADAGDVKLFEDDEWIVRYQCGFGPEVVGLRLSVPDAPVATRVMQVREPVIVEDYLAEPPDFYVGFPFTHRLRAGMAVPLVVRQAVVGCLFAWMRDTPRTFSPAEVYFARRVAASVALALENARLFAAEREARTRAEAAERDLERELGRTRVLLRASDELLTARDPDELLQRLAGVVLEATGITRTFINLIDVRTQILTPKVTAGGLSAVGQDPIPFDRLSENARKAIAGGRPSLLDYEQPGTPEADRIIAEANAARLVLFVPLVYHGLVIGHISLDEPGARYDFTAEQIRVVSSIASQAAVALRNAQRGLERAVALLEQQVQSIAFGLHDGPIQTITAAGAMLEQTGRSHDPDALLAQVAAAAGLLDHTLFEMREIMRELRPVELEEESLVAKIRQYAQSFGSQWGLPVTLKIIGTEVSVRRYLQISLFRVIQEALWNVRKHAHAQSIEIELRFEATDVECTITDDGTGFDVERVRGITTGEHWGLSSMRERMLMVGGQLEITSRTGEGTRVCARAPLDTGGEAFDGTAG